MILPNKITGKEKLPLNGKKNPRSSAKKKDEKISKEIFLKNNMVLMEKTELEDKIKERTAELENMKRALLNMLEDIEETRNKIDDEKNKTLSIITNLSDGLLVFDKEIYDKDNKLTLINPQAEKFFGVKAEDLIDKSFKDLEIFSCVKPLVDMALTKKGELFRQELEIKENFITEVSAIHLLKDGENIGSLIIIHDISREKEIEKIKSEFVSTAAHQLRTPLSAIKWTLQMIISGDLGYISPEQKTFLMQGYQSNERMINLVNDLLNVARIEEGRFGYQMSLTQLEDLIQSVVHDFDHRVAEKKINFHYFKPTEPLPKINLDSAKIRLIASNLLDNAIKYTPENGEVTISVKYDKINAEVSVKDSGIGIPKDQQNKLYGKFFRSENAVRAQTEGSGLGLFIVKNIAEKHGGKAWFISKENKGSTFYFTIPVNK